MTTEIENRIIAIVTDLRGRPVASDGSQLDDAEIATRSLTEVNVDSLAFLEVMYQVEEAYGIEFGDVPADSFATLRDIAQRVDSMTRAR